MLLNKESKPNQTNIVTCIIIILPKWFIEELVIISRYECIIYPVNVEM